MEDIGMGVVLLLTALLWMVVGTFASDREQQTEHQYLQEDIRRSSTGASCVARTNMER